MPFPSRTAQLAIRD